ncbi:unnamed protein product, partial [Polarella glacialis]
MDLPDKASEAARNAQILQELKPVLIITDSDDPTSLPADATPVLRFAQLWDMAAITQPSQSATAAVAQRAEATLCFCYTGGSTGASRCALVTHQMALWEVEKYPSVARLGRTDRVLQQHSAYWAASMYGEVDIALAFGCTLVFCEAFHQDEVVKAITTYGITCAGLVPSVLDALAPTMLPSLKLVFTWGESLEAKTARIWAQEVQLIDLLISTEYWLSLYADWTAMGSSAFGEDSRPPFRIVAGTEVWLRPVVEELSADCYLIAASGELLVSGPMVSPGYLDASRNSAAFVEARGRSWYCTHDCVERRPCGGLVFTGRADDLMKVGGAWVDAREVERKLGDILGVVEARVCRRAAFVQLSYFSFGV